MACAKDPEPQFSKTILRFRLVAIYIESLFLYRDSIPIVLKILTL